MNVFNYLGPIAMAAVFLAQATNTPLDLSHQISLLLVAMLTSKGASGVTGAGFVALAATLAAVPSVPIESLALLVGIDRLMSQCRSFTRSPGSRSSCSCSSSPSSSALRRLPLV